MTTDSVRPRLRELRTELGWTQQELADRLLQLAWMKGDRHAGVNADMVAKWVHSPSIVDSAAEVAGLWHALQDRLHRY